MIIIRPNRFHFMIRLLEYLKRQNATFTFINKEFLVKDESNKLMVEHLVSLDTVIYHRNAVDYSFAISSRVILTIQNTLLQKR